MRTDHHTGALGQELIDCVVSLGSTNQELSFITLTNATGRDGNNGSGLDDDEGA